MSVVLKCVNNCNESVMLEMKTAGVFFSINGTSTSNEIQIPGNVTVAVPIIITSDIGLQSMLVGSKILYPKGASPESKFNVPLLQNTNQNPCISITYRPMVIEKDGLMVFMILWLIALFLLLIGPFILIQDKEDEKSKPWAIVGFVCLVISLGFATFLTVSFIMVHSQRHRKVHAPTSFNHFLCRSFGKNCIKATCL